MGTCCLVASYIEATKFIYRSAHQLALPQLARSNLSFRPVQVDPTTRSKPGSQASFLNHSTNPVAQAFFLVHAVSCCTQQRSLTTTGG